MGLIAPKFLISADAQDVTAAIASSLVSLRLTDEAGLQADMLEIVLADTDDAAPIPLPRTGAELELFLGYDDETARMGLFICDEVEFSGPPDRMTIRARAATYEGTAGGKTSLQSQKTKSWKDGTKLADMAAKIAKDNNLELSIAASMKKIVLPHLSQTAESDISFLARVLKTYDGVVKPSGGKLVIIKRGESKTASGDKLPTVIVDKTNVTNYHLNIARREKPGTVVAFWHSTTKSRRVQITVGLGDPVQQLRHHYPNEAAAKAAAQSALDKKKRGSRKINLTVPGATNIIAEALLVLTGFRDEINGEWLISRVEHDLDGKGGYSCHIDAEKPTEAADAEENGEPDPVGTGKKEQPAGGLPEQDDDTPEPEPEASGELADLKSQLSTMKAAWIGEYTKSNAVIAEAQAAQDAGDYTLSRQKLEQSVAIVDAARAKYSAPADQLKAKIDALS